VLLGNKIFALIPTRVMALWKQDGHFYSGTIQRHMNGAKYLVEFDDGTQDAVTLADMRRGELRKGDVVLVSQRDQKATVARVGYRDGERLVFVLFDDKDLAEVEVKMGEIRIASRTVQTRWKDRTLHAAHVVTRENTDRPQARELDILSKTGLVTTLTPGTPDPEELKVGVRAMIENNGGVAIEQFSDIISVKGKSRSAHQWVAESSDVAWKGVDIERLFLLSDDASQTPKYLEALALGIPCLSMNWLYDTLVEHDHSSVRT
jgi:hypothetical protein